MQAFESTDAIRVVGISGNPTPYSSKSRMLLLRALSEMQAAGAEVELVEPARLPAGALLGRENHDAVDSAVRAVAEADILVVASPVIKGEIHSLLRVFLDLVPPSALSDKLAVALLTGHENSEPLGPRAAIRSLLGRLGVSLAAPPVYATDARFPSGSPELGLVREVDSAAAAAFQLARPPGRAAAGAT